MRMSKAFPSKYLKAADLGDDDVILKIDEVKMETVGQGDDEKELPVVYFKKQDKGLVLNKTNSNVIENLYGDETDDWEGQEICLFATQVDFGGKMVDAIRCKSPAKAKGAARRKSLPKRDEEEEDRPPPRKKASRREEPEEEEPEEEERPRGKGRSRDEDIPF